MMTLRGGGPQGKAPRGKGSHTPFHPGMTDLAPEQEKEQSLQGHNSLHHSPDT